MKENLPRTCAALEQGIQDGQHLGAQLFVAHHGAVVADLALGQSREDVPMTVDTINLWFSSGKPLTALAIAQLWEQGKVDLDSPVARLIPEFAAHGKDAITVRHLLSHTAGFRSADRVRDDLPWDEAIAAICAAPAEAGWIPGQRAGYQLFSSWFLLGEIVRRLDGRPIDRYIAEEIFERLGMRDCWVGIPPEKFREYGPRMGVMYFLTQGRLRPHPAWNNEASAAIVRPGGNVRGPIRELGKFYEALLGIHDETGAENLRLVQPATLRAFTARAREGMFDETFRHVLDWGLGFGVNSNRHGADSVPYGFGHFAGDSAFGHGGSQSSCGFADPEHQVVVAWVCNGMIGETAHQQRGRQINDAIYEDLKSV